MRMPACFRRILVALFCLLLLLPAAPAAWAEENDPRAERGERSVGDPEELQAITDGLIEELQLKAENISVGYCYTPTGETWYYNEDAWYYSASLYKVPLMMLYAEMEHNGELTQDSKIRGLTLSYAEEAILVYSNNDYAHVMMDNLGGDRTCREMYQQYSTMQPEDYVSNYYDYSDFTVRVMTDVLKTLYYENERFPNIVESLKQAQPGHYFKLGDSMGYEIAQKYGSYKEATGNDYNHASGIVYSPNPFLITVMTKNTGMIENLVYNFEQKLLEYTLQLDGRLEQAQADYEAAQQAQAEQQRQAEEEARRQAQAELEAAQASPSPSPVPEVTPAPAEEQAPSVAPVLIGAAGAVLLLAAAAVALALRGKRRRRNAARPRRTEQKRRGGYTPRH